MAEGRRPVKLFGKMISLPAEGHFPTVKEEATVVGVDGGGVEVGIENDHKGCKESMVIDNQNPPPQDDQEMALPETRKPEEEQEEQQEQEEQHDDDDTKGKTQKKPEKILPCPRCNSVDTKFCYYNNYNVNQPRHFCKSCQRYWTAGGTMRNVPVGSGRRKSKSTTSSSHHGQQNYIPTTTMSSEAAPVALEPNWVRPWIYHPAAATPPYWGCALINLPWQQPSLSSPSSSSTYSSSLGSKKHSRDGSPRHGETEEKCLWIPKTLRIDNPEEAAKSSIWSTIGINYKDDADDGNSGGKKKMINGGLFRAFNSKLVDMEIQNKVTHEAYSQMILNANPAAMARSVNFQETI